MYLFCLADKVHQLGNKSSTAEHQSTNEGQVSDHKEGEGTELALDDLKVIFITGFTLKDLVEGDHHQGDCCTYNKKCTEGNILHHYKLPRKYLLEKLKVREGI